LAPLAKREQVCVSYWRDNKRLRHVAADETHHHDDENNENDEDDEDADHYDDASTKAITKRLMKLPLPLLSSRTLRLLGIFATLSAKLLTLCV